MKRYSMLALACAVAFLASCARYHVTKEIKNGAALAKLKQSGIIFRLPADSPITNKRHRTSLSQWLDAHKRINGLKIIENAGRGLTVSKNEFDRFNQRSGDDDYLNYKSMGIITQYLNGNQEELGRIMTDEGLDSLIIYEVDCGLSAEMQYTDMSSMMVIVNAARQVVYLDHQFDTYPTNEYSPNVMKNHLLDDVNGRFIELMLKLKYMKEK